MVAQHVRLSCIVGLVWKIMIFLQRDHNGFAALVHARRLGFSVDGVGLEEM
jgi:hypothetical protein